MSDRRRGSYWLCHDGTNRIGLFWDPPNLDVVSLRVADWEYLVDLDELLDAIREHRRGPKRMTSTCAGCGEQFEHPVRRRVWCSRTCQLAHRKAAPS